MALLLGSITTVTAPASTMDVVNELKSESTFSKILSGIVAIGSAIIFEIFGPIFTRHVIVAVE